MVKDLRVKTDLPMMECKQALTECDGDAASAVEWLRKKYKGKLSDREDRATGEGRIAVFIDSAGKTGGIVDLRCETPSVAKNQMFVDLANAFARKVAEGPNPAPAPEEMRKDPELDTLFTDVFGRLREAMTLGQCRRVEGAFLASYVHHDDKSGVLLALDAKPDSDKNVAGDLCMHALFTQPIAIDRGGVPAEEVEKVKSLAIELATEEGKPEQIIEKITAGKVNAFYADRVLMEQLHVKTDDYGKKKIADCLKEAGVNAVTDVIIMKVGG